METVKVTIEQLLAIVFIISREKQISIGDTNIDCDKTFQDAVSIKLQLSFFACVDNHLAEVMYNDR